jgi:uncharacterized membrane protein
VGDLHPPRIAEPATSVTDVRQTNSSISFHVDRVGTPVEVKVSYFPNWQATGADGPWRVAPNLMVVVPTSHDVVLTYGSTGADTVGWLVTLASVVIAVAMAVLAWRAKRIRRARRTRRAGAAV